MSFCLKFSALLFAGLVWGSSLQAGTVPCLISGPDSACPRQTGLTFTAPEGFASYAWTLNGNGVVMGSLTGTVVQVNIGTFCSAPVVLNLTVSDGVTSQSCQKTVGVLDSTPPIATGVLPDLVVSCPSLQPPPLQPLMFDACDAELQYSLQTLTQFSSLPGNCTRTVLHRWTVRDDCGNITRVNQRLLVRDTTAPSVNCPGNQTFIGQADGSLSLPDLTVTATDNCDSSPMVTQSPPAGTLLAPGTHAVRLTARDACGNVATCSFSVTVEPPPASVALLKSVYVGHDGGARCPGLESVQGVLDTPLTYCFRVVNTGQADLAGLQVSDPALNLSPLSVGALAAGQSTLLFAETTLSSNLLNQATVNGLDPAGRPVSATDTASVERVLPSIDLQATLILDSDPPPNCPGVTNLVLMYNGDTGAHCLKVTNIGDTPLADVVVRVGEQDPHQVFLGPLAVGQSVTTRVDFVAQGSVTNLCRVVGHPAFSPPVEAVAPATILAFDAGAPLRKTVYAGHDGGAGCPGFKALAVSGPTPVTYCFEITNIGDVDAFGAVLRDETLGFFRTQGTRISMGETWHEFAEATAVGLVTNTARATMRFPEGPYSTEDSAVVGPFTAGLQVRRTAFAGHGDPSGCATASATLTAPLNHPVTHCYTVENTGSTHLWAVDLEDEGLGLRARDLIRVSGTLPLAPGETCSFFHRDRVQGSVHAATRATGRPVTADLHPVGGLIDPVGSATFTLDVGPLVP